MKLDNVGNILYNQHDLIDVAYRLGIDIWKDLKVCPDEDLSLYQSLYKKHKLPELTIAGEYNIIDFDIKNQNHVYIPDEYKQFDVLSYCLSKCHNQVSIDRVNYEYSLYKKNNMVYILRYIKYIIDLMKNNDIIWGVGRGSSVSSYILYLLELHQIDSIEYELDCIEFFKSI